jgi:hypothetical protein
VVLVNCEIIALGLPPTPWLSRRAGKSGAKRLKRPRGEGARKEQKHGSGARGSGLAVVADGYPGEEELRAKDTTEYQTLPVTAHSQAVIAVTQAP